MTSAAPAAAAGDRALTLQALVRRALSGERASIAVSCEGHDVSWGWMADVAERVAAMVDATGLPPGAPVGIVSRSRPVGCAAFAGLLAAERSIFPVYSYQSPEALGHDLAALDVGVVIADAEDWTEPTLSVARDKGMATIALSHDGSVAIAGGLATVAAPYREAYAEPTVALLTSGTTGKPKRHEVTFAQLKRCIIDAGHIDPDGYAPDAPPTIINVPLGNISGIYGFLIALAQRRRILLHRKFTLEAFVDFVQRYRPEVCGVPPAAIKMLVDSEVSSDDLRSLRCVTVGMGPVDPNSYHAFEKRFGVTILPMYGATEFVGAATMMTPGDLARHGDAKFGSVGRACRGVSLRVRDAASGDLLPADEIGLVEVRIDDVGPEWLRTNDVGRLDGDGFLYLLGRADGAINRGGFKIHPGTVEAALTRHPAVAAASVVGIPDARLGEVPVAAVELRTGAAVPDATDLMAHMRALLPVTNIPVSIKVVESLPRTPSLKIKLDAVRALFAGD